MKKIAVILLLVLSFVKVESDIGFLFSEPEYVLIMDEENGKDNTKNENKFTKDFIVRMHVSAEFSRITNTAFQLAEKIQTPPFIEKLTPPPNFL